MQPLNWSVQWTTVLHILNLEATASDNIDGQCGCWLTQLPSYRRFHNQIICTMKWIKISKYSCQASQPLSGKIWTLQYEIHTDWAPVTNFRLKFQSFTKCLWTLQYGGMLSLRSSKGYTKLYYTGQEHRSLSKHKSIEKP